MGIVDPRAIRAEAEDILGPITEGPATWGVLPEGIVVETATLERHRLARSEPCLFLGPPLRSKLLIVAALLDPSETVQSCVRAFVTVEVTQLGGVWVSGIEDAASRFAASALVRQRPELVALPAGTPTWPPGEALPVRLREALPALVVGREGTEGRVAAVLVHGARRLEPVWLEVTLA